MRKLLLLFVITFFGGNILFAQNDLYTFEKSTETYARLAGPKVDPFAFPDSLLDFELTLPFTFIMIDDTISKLGVASNGALFSFTRKTNKIKYLLAFSCFHYTLNPWTGVYTETSGTTGNRIFKIEYRSMGILSGTGNDSANYQIWLHEGTNDVSLHYGPHNNFILQAYDLQTGPAVGLFDIDTATQALYTSYYLSGNANLPDYNVKNSLTGLQGHIDDGKVYTFKRKRDNTSVNKVSAHTEIQVYPNPSAGSDITVSWNTAQNAPSTLEVTDISGRLLLSQPIAAGNTSAKIETNGLVPGVYLITIKNNYGITGHSKIIVE